MHTTLHYPALPPTTPHISSIYCMQLVALFPDPKKVVAGVWSGEVLTVDIRSVEIEKRHVGHMSKVTSVAVSGDGWWMVSGSWDGTVRRWNVEGGVDIGDPVVGHEGGVESVAMNEDHDVIASGGGDGTVRLWKMSASEVIGKPL